MVKADDSNTRRSGFDSEESLETFSTYSKDVMINAPMTGLILHRLQKSGGQT